MDGERARDFGPYICWRIRLTNSFLVVLIAALVLLVPIPVTAQRTTGTLRGQVLDPAGAAVGNAQVTATNPQTGVSIKTATTTAGTYDFPSILPADIRSPWRRQVSRSPSRLTCLCLPTRRPWRM